MLVKNLDYLVKFIEQERFISNKDELLWVLKNKPFCIVSYVNPNNLATVKLEEMYKVSDWYLVCDGYYVSKWLGFLTRLNIQPLNIDTSGVGLYTILDFVTDDKPIDFIGGRNEHAEYFEGNFVYANLNYRCLNGYSSASFQDFLRRKSSYKFVSLGSPTQEEYILENKALLVLRVEECLLVVVLLVSFSLAVE